MHTAYPPVKGEPSLHQIPPHTKHLCLVIDFIRANTHCTLLHISLYKRGLSKRHVHYAPLRVECLPQHFTYTYTHRFDSKVWKIFRTFFNVFGLVVSSTTMVCLTPLYVDVSNSLPPFRHKLSHSNLRYARSTRCNGATRTFAIYIYIPRGDGTLYTKRIASALDTSYVLSDNLSTGMVPRTDKYTCMCAAPHNLSVLKQFVVAVLWIKLIFIYC